jgi:hypothetical protein
MGNLLLEMFRELRGREKPLRKVERRQAKFYIKNRLRRLFPELAQDDKALEELYQSLDLEARPGLGPGGATSFEVIIPDRYIS